MKKRFTVEKTFSIIFLLIALIAMIVGKTEAMTLSIVFSLFFVLSGELREIKEKIGLVN